MFSFMKKDKEKDREKKEKHDKKKKDKDKKERQNMTPEEMSRIEEMKKGHGVFRRFSDKQTKRHSQKPFDRESTDEDTRSTSSRESPSKERPSLTRPQPHPRHNIPGAKGSPPATMPKPKSKSILKGKGDHASPPSHSLDNLDDSKLLQENTRRNEDMFYASSPAYSNSEDVGSERFALRPSPGKTSIPPQISVSSPEEDEKETQNTNNSRLKLPKLVQPEPPRIRVIVAV